MQIDTVKIQPGDRIVVSTDHILSALQVDAMKHRVQEAFPGHEVIVITGGIKLQVVRAA